MEFLAGFAAGFAWFWILLAVWSILMFWWVEVENAWLSTLSVILALALLQFFGDMKPLTYFAENPLVAVGGVVGYFICGTLWSIGKWWFFVRRQRRKYDEAKAAFLEGRRVTGTVIPENLREEWGKSYHPDFEWKPKARDHKRRIMIWMCYWPWSLLWTVISDPVKEVFEHIYHYLQRAYQAISDAAFRGTEDDFVIPKKPVQEETKSEQ